MTIHQAVRELESRGITLQFKPTGGITLKFPPGYRRSWADDKLIEILQASREDVTSYLQGREDARLGFQRAEPMPDTVELRTKDIEQALQIGRAISKGLAVLEGPVIYNPVAREVTVRYRRFSPFNLEERPDNHEFHTSEVEGSRRDGVPGFHEDGGSEDFKTP